MKQLITILCVTTLLLSCKTETKEGQIPVESISTEVKALTTAEKIAQAHGFDNWKRVKSIAFTFQVDRDGQQGKGRSWIWFPKNDSIFMNAGEQHVAYKRNLLDSVSLNTDRAFINDKFWLLIPFQLVWDKGTTISEVTNGKAPISKTEMSKITLTYGNEGGYTPGDAYDIYFDKNYIIKEWVFRKANSETPTMTTTFENYEDFNGIKIAKNHKNAEGNFDLYFSGIEITLTSDL